MTAALGQLPDFGSGRGLGSTAQSKNDVFNDLDDDLAFLLEDNSNKQSKRTTNRQKEKTKVKTSASKSVKSDDDDFYGQMAALANEDFDGEEEDVKPLTEAESKKLADSVNLDDMDANLFGSFSRSQNQKRRHSATRKDSSAAKPTTTTTTSRVGRQGEVGAKSTRSRMSDNKVQESSSDKTSDAKSMAATATKEKAKKKQSFDFDEDDLLDLLSDSGDEDLAPKKREKPKIQIKSKSSLSATSTPTVPAPGSSLVDNKDTQNDGKPITSANFTAGNCEGDDIERPRTSSGKQGVADSINSSSLPLSIPPALSASETKPKQSSSTFAPDILKIDHPSAKASTSGGSLNSTQIDFDDDEDDILSGMGLDDSDVVDSAKSKVGGKKEMDKRGSSSMLEESLGAKKKSSSIKPKTESKKVGQLGDDASNGKEDDFQFGGYLPSAAADDSTTTSTATAQANKSNLKVPSERRRSTEFLDSLTTRPGSAPTSAKKSVRFSDTIEMSDRPSSSPAAGEVSKQPPSTREGGRTALVDAPSELEGLSAKVGGDGAKKPPLPRRSATAVDSASTKSKEVGGEPLDEGRSDGSGDMREDSSIEQKTGGQAVTNGVESLDGLFLSGERAPHPSPLRGRGRQVSLTKPSANSLFEDGDQEKSALTADSAAGLGSEEKPFMKKEGLNEASKKEEKKLERPVFPWQKARQSRSHSVGSIGGTTSQGPNLPAKELGKTGDHMTVPHDAALDQGSQLASVRGMLLQPQKQAQEQFPPRLQSPVGGTYGAAAIASSAKGSSVDEEKLKGQVKQLEEQVKELEAQLQAEKLQHSEVQKKVGELEKQLEGVDRERKRVEAEAKEHREMTSELEDRHQKSQVELTNQLEELKMKLHRVELERTQLQYSVESGSSRHSEELEAVQKSHDARIKAMEESYQRRENRWREEAESEAARHQDKLQQIEREKMDAVLALKKKIDALEVSKTNEISRLQDIHRTSLDDLKREHEQDKHHLLSMHRQEMEALKAAHSHTRMLSELSQQVESSSREVSQLQAKLDHAHSARIEEQAERAKRHQEQLKTLEERLVKQQAENSTERERLHLLISKLELHISQQGKMVEQERWQLQQDSARLKMQQTAFEEERASFLRKMAEDRDQLQLAREKFLTEQRDVLAKCYGERKSLAADRAELDVLKKKLQEQEERESQKKLQVEAELEASRNHIREESDRINSEAVKLKQDHFKLKTESEAVAKERERLEALSKEVEHRSQKAESLHQSALSIKKTGEESLHEAEKMRDQLEYRSKTVEQQLIELREKEKQIATERLLLARQRRERGIHAVARLSPDDDAVSLTESSVSSPQHDLTVLATSTESAPVSTHHSLHTTFLPPLSLHQANISSLEPHPLLSSTAIPHQPAALISLHQTDVHRTTQVPSPTPQLTQQPPLAQKVPMSAVQYRTKYSSSGRRHSPASSPTHSQPWLPMLSGMLGSSRSFKSELTQIEHTRNLRQLALLAEQDYEELEEESKFLESLQTGSGYLNNSSGMVSTMN